MSEPPIAIAVVGSFALQGLERLQATLAVPHTLISIPDDVPEAEKLRLLEAAQVILATHLTPEMARSASGLRLVHTVGAGIEAVDLAALSPGVPVCNVYFHGVGIAEYVMLGMLAATRDLVAIHNRFRTGDWAGSYHSNAPIPPPKPELHGKTVLLLGVGTIGREVAVRARAFGMTVLGWRRSGAAGEPVPGVDELHGPEALDELLPRADYVIVAVPLGEDTRELLDARRLGLLKPTAILVNVARGPVIAEEALYRVLAEARIGAYVGDVWYEYPEPPSGGRPFFPSRFPFHELDNVIMTPHISGWTEGVVAGRFRFIAENINRLVRGEPLENQVHPPPEAGREAAGDS